MDEHGWYGEDKDETDYYFFNCLVIGSIVAIGVAGGLITAAIVVFLYNL